VLVVAVQVPQVEMLVVVFQLLLVVMVEQEQEL